MEGKRLENEHSSKQSWSKQVDPFFAAIISGGVDAVRKALANGHDPNSTDPKTGKPALRVAAFYGQTGVMELLLEKKADVNYAGKTVLSQEKNFDELGPLRRPPIHDAAFGGHGPAISLLIKAGANVKEKDAKGDTPLHLSVASKNLDAVITLCENGAPLDVTNEPLKNQIIGQTPLHKAILTKQTAIALELIRRGAKIDCQDGEGHSPYFDAIISGMSDVVDAMHQRLTANVEQDKQDSANYEPKAHLRKLGLDSVDENGNTLLHRAAQEGQVEHTQLLLSLGLDPNTRNNKQCTPLHLAVKNGKAAVLLPLHESGADPALVDEDQNSLLHYAAKKGHSDCLNQLKKWFNHLSLENEHGDTPLHFAAQKCRFEILAALCDPDSINHRNNNDETPLDLLLETSPLDYDETDNEVIQSYNAQIEPCLELLLQHGAHVSQETVQLANKNFHLNDTIKLRIQSAFEEHKRQLPYSNMPQEANKAVSPTLTPAVTVPSSNRLALDHSTAAVAPEESSSPNAAGAAALLMQFLSEAENDDLSEIDGDSSEALEDLLLPAPKKPSLSPLHAELVQYFEALLLLPETKEKKELEDFIAQLKQLPTLEALSSALTPSGKNLLHVIGLDSTDHFMPLLMRLTQAAPIKPLLHMKTEEGETPFHTACHYHNINLFEYCISQLSLEELLLIASEKTVEFGYNAFHLLCISTYDEKTHSLKALFQSPKLPTETLHRGLRSNLQIDPNVFLMMQRFRSLFVQATDELIGATDNHGNTSLMLCAFTCNTALIQQLLATFLQEEYRRLVANSPKPCLHITPLKFLCAFGDTASVSHLLSLYKEPALEVHRQRLLKWCYFASVPEGSFEEKERFHGTLNLLLNLYRNHFKGGELEIAVLGRHIGSSVLIKSLNQDGIVIQQLLDKPHVSDRDNILIELLCDVAQEERENEQASQIEKSPSFSRFFITSLNKEPDFTLEKAPVMNFRVLLRTQYIAHLFKGYEWPAVLIQNLAKSLANTPFGTRHAERMDTRFEILSYIQSRHEQLIKENEDDSADAYLSHSILILALFYKVGNALTPEESRCITQFKDDPEILHKVALLLELIEIEKGVEQADLFLRRIIESRSLLKVAFFEVFPFKSFAESDLPQFFIHAIRRHFSTLELTHTVNSLDL